MHERTQRSVARLAFVACCAVPTWITLTCLLVTWTPWYHQRRLTSLETYLATETGLLAEVEEFETLSPTSTRLGGVRFYDPETGDEVARVAQVLWSREDDQIQLVLQQPELQAKTLGSSWHLIHERFLCRPERQQTVTRFIANDLTIHSTDDAITLSDVRAWIEPESSLPPVAERMDPMNSSDRSLVSGKQTVHSQKQPPRLRAIQTTIECVPASHIGSPPIRASIRRQFDGGAPTTKWTLDTTGIPLPCSALSEYFASPWSDCGDEATFTGTVTATLNANQWGLENLSGTFQNVSLYEIFKEQTHRLAGRAVVQLDRCRIVPAEKIVDISGSIEATEGVVGRSLLKMIQSHLRCEVQWPPGDEDVLYDQLAFQFGLRESELWLSGTCRREVGYDRLPIGVVLRRGQSPIAISSPEKMPSIRLMSVLASAQSELVPLTHLNQHLIPLLIPSNHSSDRASSDSPGASISGPSISGAGISGDGTPLRGQLRSARRYDGVGPLVGQPPKTR